MADEGRIIAPARKPILVSSGDRGEDLRTLTVRIPSALHQRLKLHAALSEVFIMDIVAEAVEDYLQQKAQD
jgi:predicted HicB family RNase H-like nuclease